MPTAAAGAAPVTSTGQLVGTPGYLAPERVRGARAGPSSDLYSLGIVAWECLAGAAPFTGAAVELAIAHRDRAPATSAPPAQPTPSPRGRPGRESACGTGHIETVAGPGIR